MTDNREPPLWFRDHNIERAFIHASGALFPLASHGASLSELIARAIIGFLFGWAFLNLFWKRDNNADPRSLTPDRP
jgi:hypothetical protein